MDVNHHQPHHLHWHIPSLSTSVGNPTLDREPARCKSGGGFKVGDVHLPFCVQTVFPLWWISLFHGSGWDNSCSPWTVFICPAADKGKEMLAQHQEREEAKEKMKGRIGGRRNYFLLFFFFPFLFFVLPVLCLFLSKPLEIVTDRSSVFQFLCQGVLLILWTMQKRGQAREGGSKRMTNSAELWLYHWSGQVHWVLTPWASQA